MLDWQKPLLIALIALLTALIAENTLIKPFKHTNKFTGTPEKWDIGAWGRECSIYRLSSNFQTEKNKADV